MAAAGAAAGWSGVVAGAEVEDAEAWGGVTSGTAEGEAGAAAAGAIEGETGSDVVGAAVGGFTGPGVGATAAAAVDGLWALEPEVMPLSSAARSALTRAAWCAALCKTLRDGAAVIAPLSAGAAAEAAVSDAAAGAAGLGPATVAGGAEVFDATAAVFTGWVEWLSAI